MDYFFAKTLMRKVAPKGLGEGKATDLLHSCQSNDVIVGVYAEFFTGQYLVYQHKIVLKKPTTWVGRSPNNKIFFNYWFYPHYFGFIWGGNLKEAASTFLSGIYSFWGQTARLLNMWHFRGTNPALKSLSKPSLLVIRKKEFLLSPFSGNNFLCLLALASSCSNFLPFSHSPSVPKYHLFLPFAPHLLFSCFPYSSCTPKHGLSRTVRNGGPCNKKLFHFHNVWTGWLTCCLQQ